MSRGSLLAAAKVLRAKFNALTRVNGGCVEIYSTKRREWRRVRRDYTHLAVLVALGGA